MAKLGTVVQSSKPKGNREEFVKQLPEPGTQLGVLLHIINLGEKQTKFGTKNQVLLTYELPNDLMTDGPNKGKPLLISEIINAVLTDAKSSKVSTLRKRVNAIVGKSTDGTVDFQSLVGKGALLTVIHKPYKDSTFANIIETSPLMKGMVVPELVNESFVLLDPSDPDEAVIEKLKESKMKWVLDKINLSPKQDSDF